jgi:magnesium chelatase subunit D
MSAGHTIWSDATAAATLFAVDPIGTGGICVRAGAGPIRDRWLDILRNMLPPSMPFRKLPPAVSDGRLLGGIDLAATLQAGRPVMERGLLSEVDGGVLLAVMAERLSASTVAHVNAVLDAGEVVIERDGLSQRDRSSFGIVALDEGIDHEQLPASLSDRLAFHADLRDLSVRDIAEFHREASAIEAARLRLQWIMITSDRIEALCHAAASLGIASLRAPLLAVSAAKAMAALEDVGSVQPEHVELAAALVLGPRATRLPTLEPKVERLSDQEAGDAESQRREDVPLDDVVLEAAQAAIPPDLLKRLQEGALCRPRDASVGRQGVSKAGPRRGRPIGTRRGELGPGARLNVLETLRTAAPWQKLRRRAARKDACILIRKGDFRVTRFKERSATSTIFVVDASGSQALHRLAEVKGAVELLLADCYVRRDEVALIAFRGQAAELILPPTRSLTRARRSLAALPGSGGTPLSAAIESATTLALAARSKGHAPTVVLLTDGRANVSRDGRAGRAAAEVEAQQAARQLRATGIPAVVIDTSPRPQPQAARIAAEMSARYVALPYADASRLSRAVQTNIQAGDHGRLRAWQ